MNKKIFRSTVLVALLVLTASITLIMGVLYNYFENQLKSELKSKAEYISYALENEGISYLDRIDKQNERITLVSPNGTVIADTAADISALDNHAERDEIKQALKDGSGTSVRYSDTLTEKIVYYAVRLDSGNVLRISTTQYTVVTILLGLLQPVVIIFIIAVILSFVLSLRVSKSIIKPINSLDLENPEKNVTYDELSPLLGKISAQRKTIDNQLWEAKQKQEEFRLITENMSEGLIVIDRNMQVLTYNSSALKLLDISEPVSGNVFSLNRTKGFRNVVESALSGDRTESEMSIDEKCCSLIANPVYYDTEIIGAVIVILDVTESVNREQLRREFTSNVSHELKTPLTSISGFAEIMKSGGTPDETVVDFSKSIYDEAQRLITLVSDIIKISELDEKSVQFENEQVNLYELSLDVTNRLKSQADKKNIKLNVIGEKTEISGVRKIIDEMIYNLCDNAIKYNKENGTVDIIITSNQSSTKIMVRDTGIGIPKFHQSRIFERFYRVDKSHSKEIGGTGLGLSIVKHAARLHNADIELHSEPDKGTTITVAFPAKYDYAE